MPQGGDRSRPDLHKRADLTGDAVKVESSTAGAENNLDDFR